MSVRVKTAILPVAGLGTRLLPATKAVPKELLPVYDTPLLQFAIDEALAAGAERLVFVNHPDKRIIERQVMRDETLLSKLQRAGKDEIAEALECAGIADGAEACFVYQREQLGLGHAVLCAREAALDGPVAVILPDDLIVDTPCLPEMVAAYDPDTAGLMVAALEVEHEEISRYGAFDVIGRDGRSLAARRLVEKPPAEAAPSLFGVVGRYILPTAIFEELAQTAPGAGGEIQLTDAISALTGRHGLAGFLFSGLRFDCGHHDGLLAAANWRAEQVATTTGRPFAVAAQ